MTCPKCQGSMRSYERNGVHVDQCTECRGIFLDRGELERLIDAETSWHAQPSSSPPAHAAPAQPTSSPPAHAAQAPQTPVAGSLGALVGEVLQQAKAHKQGASHRSDQAYGRPRKKKDSFLGELFG